MRKDERFTWTHDDDIQLVETILRTVRHGGSVIDGCREYSENTNGERSVDASKFRFHTQLKEQYATAYNMAKEEGKKVKQAKRKYVTQEQRFENVFQSLIADNDPPSERRVEVEDIMVLLKKFKEQAPIQNDDKLVKENEKLTKQNEELRKSNMKLSKAFNEMEHDYKEIKKALSVLKKAGLVLDIPAPVSTTKYKVGADGLIETVE